jgi:uncharacterized protein (TIGR00369 family)
MECNEDFLEWLNKNKLFNTLGIAVEEAKAGEAHSRLKRRKDLCFPFPGQPHGGVLFTLMDVTMASAVFSSLEEGFNCATVQLDIHYTAPARGDTFLCHARVIHRTGRMCFVRGEILGEKGQLLAMGQATFRIIKSEMMQAVHGTDHGH